MCLSKVLLILGCVFWLQNLPLSISQINILRTLGQGGRGGGGLYMSVTDLSYLLIVLMLLADMSRRKLRLGRRKKSLERQKPKVLTVSIPRAAVSVQLHPGLFCSPSLSNALQHSGHIDQPVSQLTVSLPI